MTKSATALAALLMVGGCCVPLKKLTDRHLIIAGSAMPAYSPPNGLSISEQSEVWRDQSRQRDVPVRIYAPAHPSAPLPLVVFSHGIGEDRDSYVWFGRALASAGYVVIHVTHAGTDKAVLRRGYLNLYRNVKKKENWVARPADVSFVITKALRGRRDIDGASIAAAGHSAGAFTSLALAGMTLAGGEQVRDPRVKAAVAISMPRMDGVVPPGGYDSIAAPVLHMSGTCDTSLIYRTFPRHRRIAFEQTHAPDQVMVTLDRVNHDTFSNATAPQHELIAKIVIAYLNGELKADASARRWLREGGLSAVTGVAVERK